MILTSIIARAGLMFAAHGLKIGLAVGLLAMVATWDRGRIWRAEERGKESVRVETKKANDVAAQTSDRVRSKSQSGRVRGQRDPNSID